MQNSWTNFYDKHGRFYLQPHPALNKFINIAKKRGVRNVLDLGCGSGRHLVKLASEGFNVSGLDFSPSAAQLAEKWLHEKGLEGDVVVGNFDDKSKDFKNNSFEAVIAVNSLEYANQPELENNLEQIRRMLKPQGIAMIVYRSKETTLKHPEVETLLFEEEELTDLMSKYFTILDISQDKDKNFVIIGEVRKN